MSDLQTTLLSAATTLMGTLIGLTKWLLARLDKRFDTIDSSIAEVRRMHRDLHERLHEHDIALLDHHKRLDAVEDNTAALADDSA